MKLLLRISPILLLLPLLGGCNKDSDPTAKVNEPGYYNGPAKGRGAATATTSGDKAAPN